MVEEYLSLRRAVGARGPEYNRALRTLVQRAFGRRAEENGALPGAPAVPIISPTGKLRESSELLNMMNSMRQGLLGLLRLARELGERCLATCSG